MPRTKSARRALRASLRRRAQNLAYRAGIRREERVLRTARERGEREKVILLLPRLFKAYDKAAKRGIISRARAARKKRQAALLTKRMK